jgi:hypothetical protein
MFITWPDMWYHSSHDTPDKQDPTQYKRAAVVGVGAMAVLATGGDQLATRVTSENLGRGTERLGEAHRKGAGYFGDATTASALTAAYREAWVAVKHQAAVEKHVIRSTHVLYVDTAAAEKRLGTLEASIDKTATSLIESNRTLYGLAAARLQGPSLPAGDPAMTDTERVAARTMVESVPGAGGGRGGRGGGGGGGGGRGGGQAGGPAIPQHMNAELNILLGQKKTVLEIRDFLSGEFEPLPLETLMKVLRARETAGSVKLVEKPSESPARKD